MNAVLIDTPLWQDYFRDGTGHRADVVAEFLEQGQAVTCGFVVAELLADAATVEAAARLNEAMLGLPRLAMSDEVFRHAGELAVSLRGEGLALPLPRLLVAATAAVHRAALLTADARLHAAARLRPLNLLCV